jgi:hypothetical protein
MAWRKIHSSISNPLHSTDELYRLKTPLSYRIYFKYNITYRKQPEDL